MNGRKRPSCDSRLNRSGSIIAYILHKNKIQSIRFFYFFSGIIVAILVGTIYQIVCDFNEGKTKITFHIISFFTKIIILSLSLYFEIKYGYKIFFATLIIIAIMGIFV